MLNYASSLETFVSLFRESKKHILPVDNTSGGSEIHQTSQVSQSFSLSVVTGLVYCYDFNHFEEKVQCTILQFFSSV